MKKSPNAETRQHRRHLAADRLDLAQPHPVLKSARKPGAQRWALHAPPPVAEELSRGDTAAVCTRCGDPIPPRSQRPGSLRCPKCRDKRGAMTAAERVARKRTRRERTEASEALRAQAAAEVAAERRRASVSAERLEQDRRLAAMLAAQAAIAALPPDERTIRQLVVEMRMRRWDAEMMIRNALTDDAIATGQPEPEGVRLKTSGRTRRVQTGGGTVPGLGKVKDAFKLGPLPKRLKPGARPKPRVEAAGATHREWARAVEWAARIRPETIRERDWEMLRLSTVHELDAPTIAKRLGGTVRPEAIRKALARARATWTAAQSV
jgi:uncharacterized Zn finger protein (UPF0148 family)